MRSIGPILVSADSPPVLGRTGLTKAENIKRTTLRVVLAGEIPHRLAGLGHEMIPVEDWEGLLHRTWRMHHRGENWALRYGVRVVADYICRHHVIFEEPIYHRAIEVLAQAKRR